MFRCYQNGHLVGPGVSVERPEEFDDADLRLEAAEKLRTRAARYRRLADLLTDPRVLAVVEACASELEANAAAVEPKERDS